MNYIIKCSVDVVEKYPSGGSKVVNTIQSSVELNMDAIIAANPVNNEHVKKGFNNPKDYYIYKKINNLMRAVSGSLVMELTR